MKAHVLITAALSSITLVMIVGCVAMSPRPTTPIPTPSIDNEGPCSSIDEVIPVETVAEMTYYETPRYPRLPEQAGLEGTVWIKALVGKRGSVLDAVVYKSSGTPALDKAALAAAPKCRFNPATQDGKPICMWVTYKVEFSLEYR